MGWQPIDRLQISGDRFLRRRLECALVGIDPDIGIASLRTPARSLAVGLVVASVVLAGSLILALLRPQPDLGSAPIVMERVSGALYVRLGDALHPVLNLASARLIARTSADPRPVTAAALARSKRGPLLGIPGAPTYVGSPLAPSDVPWTVCDNRDGTTVIVGAEPQSGVLSRDETLLVTPSSGGSTYLLFNGRRAVVKPDDAAVARAAEIEGRKPLAVSRTLLNLIPESPPIAAPRIPDAGMSGPDALRGFSVGSVLRVSRGGGDEYYVVLKEGVQRVGQFAADLVRYADSRGARTVISLAPDVVRGVESTARLPVSEFPDRPRLRSVGDGAAICARWAGAAVSFSVGDMPVPAGQVPVSLTQADGGGPAVDAVYLAPGRSAYVRATGLSGGGAGTRYLVGDTGVGYPVHDDDAAHDLGLPDATAAAPWPVLSRLPAGPELSRSNALVAQDVSPSG